MTSATPSAAPVRFEWPVRVYYEDTDAGGIVYYANYLRFMERARSEWLRSLDVRHDTLRERDGLMLVVSRADTRYAKPAVLDDKLNVTVALTRVRRASLDLYQSVQRNTEELCSSHVQVACIDAEHHRPRPFPPSVLGVLR